MKRIFALVLAVAMICAVCCGCGEAKKKGSNEKVSTTVSAKYDDGYAKRYASSATKDKDGNNVYEFSGDEYERFTTDYNNHLSAKMSSEIVGSHSSKDQEKPYGQFVYIKEEKKAVIVGLMPGQYKEAQAKKEADIAAEYGFKYFQNLKDPVDNIQVIFCNANNQNEIYGSFNYKL